MASYAKFNPSPLVLLWLARRGFKQNHFNTYCFILTLKEQHRFTKTEKKTLACILIARKRKKKMNPQEN